MELKKLQEMSKEEIPDITIKRMDMCMWTYAKIQWLAWGDDMRVYVQYQHK